MGNIREGDIGQPPLGQLVRIRRNGSKAKSVAAAHHFDDIAEQINLINDGVTLA